MNYIVSGYRPLLIFLFSFLIYLTTLCPTIFTGDSAELVTAAATLGIPHAPGYPLFTLLGKIFTIVIPFGNIAYRVNLMNAVFAAGTVGLVYWLLKSLAVANSPAPPFSKVGTIIPALVLAVSKTFWSQALVTEVFVLNAFLAVLMLILLQQITKDVRYLYLFTFCLGIASGNQHTIILFVPGFLVLLVWKIYHNRKLLTLRPIIYSGLFLVLGVSINFYLMYRAKRYPLINFGHPDTLQRLIAVLTRREFGSFQLHPTALPFFSVEVIIQHLKEYGKLFYENFGLWTVVGILGIWQLFKQKIWLLTLTVLFLVSGIFFILYSNLMPSALSFWRLQRFHILPNLIFVLFIGYGIQWLIAKFPKMKYFVVSLLFIGLVILGLPNYLNCSLRNNYTVHDLGKNILSPLGLESFIFIDAKTFDEPGSAIHYLRVAEKNRRDIKFYYRSGTMMSGPDNESSIDYLSKNVSDRQTQSKEIETKIIDTAPNPIYYLAIDRDSLPAFRFKVNGLVYELVRDKRLLESPLHLNPLPRGEMDGVRGIEDLYVFRDKKEEWSDYSLRQVLVHYPYFSGKKYFEQKNLPEAKKWFHLAALIGHDMDWLHSNIGSLFSQAGDLSESEKYFIQAYKLNPYFPYTHFGLGFLYFQKKDYPQAIKHFTEATRIKTDYAEAYYNLGVAYIENKNYSDGVKALETYLALVPTTPNAELIRNIIKQLKG